MVMGSRKSFASSHFLLKPEKMGLLDLPKILFSRNLEEIEFVETFEDREERSQALPFQPISLVQLPDQIAKNKNLALDNSFRFRFLLLISTLVQIFLLKVAKPLALFGHLLELSLNLISDNSNVFVFLCKLLRGTGKEVVPDRESEKFGSINAFLDKRETLDGSIKNKDGKYNVALSMMAAKESYENLAHVKTRLEDWKMEFVESYGFSNENGKSTTDAFIFRDKGTDTYVVTFRGTEPFNAYEWCTDFDFSWFKFPGVGRIHGGFMKALGLKENGHWPEENAVPKIAYYVLRDKLREVLGGNDNARLIVTGHSLGGALAIVFTATLIIHEETSLLERLDEVYTFGQPRVGDETFAKYMNDTLRENNIRFCRIVYSSDMVPRLPFDDNESLFKHFGPCYYFNRSYGYQIVETLPNKNYFSALMAIPMRVNALMELGRSFIIGWLHGSDYEEGWLMVALRVFGLIAPGIPSHFTRDYVNTTRLGAFLPYCDYQNL